VTLLRRFWLPLFILAFLPVILFGFSVSSCRAEGSAPSAGRGWLDPLHYRDAALDGLKRLNRVEFVEMLSAVLSGADMGPNDGWFRHGSETRYDWAWLARLHGIKPDQAIHRKDFKGPLDLFDRLDRNHDNLLKKDDFDWSNNSAFARMAMPSSNWFRMIDANSNGRITREEWDAFFTKIARKKGYVTPEDLREALPVMPPPKRADEPEPKYPEPSLWVLLTGLLSGELGSPFPGPNLGQLAPDFTLPVLDGVGRITLSQYRGEKPVVLIFGNFT
jgi:hypothetical protein